MYLNDERQPFINSLDELNAELPTGVKIDEPKLRRHTLARIHSFFEQQDTVFLVNFLMMGVAGEADSRDYGLN
jgi:hypothetical protein